MRGGFSGVLAPLWSVEDDIAHGIAEAFYKEALPSGGGASRPVGQLLADLRAKYLLEKEEARHSTHLAYVFFGHPNLKLAVAT